VTARSADAPPHADDGVAEPTSRTHRAALAACAGLTRLAFVVIAKVEIGDADVRPVAGRGAIIAINHRSMLDFFVATVAFRHWRIYPHTFAGPTSSPDQSGVTPSDSSEPSPQVADGAQRSLSPKPARC